MLRRHLLAALAALLATPAPAQPADPVAVVRGFYREGAGDHQPFSRRLAALYQAALENSSVREIPVAGLDFDPAINGQDTEPDTYRSARFAVASQRGDRATVTATFRNGGPQEIRFDLVREGGRWLVDEIRSLKGERWVWSELLKKGAEQTE
ncbi:MAG TPA: DUF3828 domain-containing protein [Beijerinckiaceae bacterium]|nr:DUF3828 domain-containing protein [Beijerinckiaceae bacterium]